MRCLPHNAFAEEQCILKLHRQGAAVSHISHTNRITDQNHINPRLIHANSLFVTIQLESYLWIGVGSAHRDLLSLAIFGHDCRNRHFLNLHVSNLPLTFLGLTAASANDLENFTIGETPQPSYHQTLYDPTDRTLH